MNFNKTWFKYDTDTPQERVPQFGEMILCFRADGDTAVTFEGYFMKDDRYEYVFVYEDGEKCVDGESIEIDYWIPMSTLLPKNNYQGINNGI